MSADRQSSRLSLVWLLVLVLVMGISASVSTSRTAVAGSRALHILVMGDSYSAGNGSTSDEYFDEDHRACYRNHDNYAGRFAAELEPKGKVTNVACSGATTDDFFDSQHVFDYAQVPLVKDYFMNPQLEAVSNDADIIFLSIGGNDAGFADIVKDCLISVTASSTDCAPDLSRAEQMLSDGSLRAKIRRVLTRIGEQGDASTKIVLVGYPDLERDRTPAFVLPGSPSVDVGKRVRALTAAADGMDRALVDELRDPRIVFHSMRSLFSGHELLASCCRGPQSLAPGRWLTLPAVDSTTKELFYHPNPKGWKEEAKSLLDDDHIPQGASKLDSRPAGDVWSWGTNYDNLLGTGSKATKSSSPVHVGGLDDVVQLTNAYNAELALTKDGHVWGWGGDGEFGQFGDPNLRDVKKPRRIPGLSGIRQIDSEGTVNLALGWDGQVRAWGENDSGQLGLGSAGDDRTPTKIPGLSHVVDIAAFKDGGAAVKSDGSLWTWGDNTFGTLGFGDRTARNTPTRVASFPGATQVSSGYYSLYVLTFTGRVYSSGLTNLGRTGRADLLLEVVGLPEVDRLLGGDGTALGIAKDQSLWAWSAGNDYGELGDGKKTTDGLPKQTLLRRVKTASGNAGGFAVSSDGSAAAWGSNAEGKLGNGKGDNYVAYKPVAVKKLDDVFAVDAADLNGYALVKN